MLVTTYNMSAEGLTQDANTVKDVVLDKLKADGYLNEDDYEETKKYIVLFAKPSLLSRWLQDRLKKWRMREDVNRYIIATVGADQPSYRYYEDAKKDEVEAVEGKRLDDGDKAAE